MDIQKKVDAPLNARGGQESFLMLTKGQFRSQHLTVTWVDCPPGSEQPMHEHASEEQVYVIIRGRGTMRVGEEEREVEAGTLVFVPPRTPHAIRNERDELMVFVSAASPAIDVGALEDVFRYSER
jgi:mannose-6-phosphate isomerase-like protein (cupin superfamily)